MPHCHVGRSEWIFFFLQTSSRPEKVEPIDKKVYLKKDIMDRSLENLTYFSVTQMASHFKKVIQLYLVYFL